MRDRIEAKEHLVLCFPSSVSHEAEKTLLGKPAVPPSHESVIYFDNCSNLISEILNLGFQVTDDCKVSQDWQIVPQYRRSPVQTQDSATAS